MGVELILVNNQCDACTMTMLRSTLIDINLKQTIGLLYTRAHVHVLILCVHC